MAELRSFIFIDQLQPQTLCYMATWMRGRLPRTSMAAQIIEVVAPGFSEDFGSFQALVPGVMFFLGVSNPEKGTVGMPHTPSYVADDESIFVGARAMAAVLLDFVDPRRGP